MTAADMRRRFIGFSGKVSGARAYLSDAWKRDVGFCEEQMRVLTCFEALRPYVYRVSERPAQKTVPDSGEPKGIDSSDLTLCSLAKTTDHARRRPARWARSASRRQ
jgi:hypothetical protein